MKTASFIGCTSSYWLKMTIKLWLKEERFCISYFSSLRRNGSCKSVLDIGNEMPLFRMVLRVLIMSLLSWGCCCDLQDVGLCALVKVSSEKSIASLGPFPVQGLLFFLTTHGIFHLGYDTLCCLRKWIIFLSLTSTQRILLCTVC